MRVRIRYFTNKESYGRIFYLPQNINHTLFPTFGLQLNYEQNEENIIRKIYNRCLENPAPFDVNWKERYFCYFGNLENIRYFSHYIEIENKQIFSQIQNLISNYNKFNSFEYKIGGKIFDSRKKYVMGILNVTSDSFYDGGKYFDEVKIKERIDEFVQSSVDIIDIGGESTRPGSEPISADEELNRILPAVEYALSKNAIVSVDTYKSKVAERCLELGAHIINDISGFKFDPEMANVCKSFNATVVLMHIRGTPKTMQENPHYDDTMAEIFDELNESIRIAESAGIKQIFIDPGIGFGKRLFDNYEILNRLEELKFLGYPILVGLSRKSFIGKLLNLRPEERLTGTITANAVALLKGASIVRVHDYKEAQETKNIVEAIINPDLTKE